MNYELYPAHGRGGPVLSWAVIDTKVCDNDFDCNSTVFQEFRKPFSTFLQHAGHKQINAKSQRMKLD